MFSAGLAKRQALVKAAGCKLSVSVHFNAVGDGKTFNSATGVCTYIHSNPARVGNSAALATCVQSRLICGAKQNNRGVHSDAFAEVNCAAMGTSESILVELAFMTNQAEAETMMANENFWIEAAEEICHGICDRTGVTYVERDDEEMAKTYDSISAMPDWAQATMQKLWDKKYITSLGFTEEALRIFVVNDRAGLYK